MTSLCALCVMATTICVAVASGNESVHPKWYEDRYHWIMEQYEANVADAADVRDSRERSEREWAANSRLEKEFQGTCSALIDVLEKTRDEGTKYRVTVLLEHMRSQDAVLPLVKEIRMCFPDGDRITDALSMYPAARALAAIGEPAVRMILAARARLPASEHELRLFAAVVYRHYGSEPEVGRFHIELMLKKAQEKLDHEGQGKSSRAQTWHTNLTRILEFYKAAQRGESIVPPPESKNANHPESEKGAD